MMNNRGSRNPNPEGGGGNSSGSQETSRRHCKNMKQLS